MIFEFVDIVAMNSFHQKNLRYIERSANPTISCFLGFYYSSIEGPALSQNDICDSSALTTGQFCLI